MIARLKWIAAMAFIVTPVGLRADQGGTAFWLSGQYASMAAVPASPGWSLSPEFYIYGGRADAAKALSIGTSVVLGTKSQLAIFSLTPTYTLAAPVLGGALSLGLSFGGGYGSVSSTGTVATAHQNVTLRQSGSIWGASDLAPIVSLAWTRGLNNWMVYLTGNIPVGSYNS